MEQEKIIATVTRLFNGADEQDWTKVQHAMAAEVWLDFSSMTGASPSFQTPDQIAEGWAAFLPGFDKTHHQLSGFRLTQNENNALVHYYGKADHFIGSDVWTVEGTYDTELSKTDEDWLIVKHKFNLEQQSGDTSLPAKAVAIMKGKNS